MLVSTVWKEWGTLPFALKHLFTCWECDGSMCLLGTGTCCTLRSWHLCVQSYSAASHSLWLDTGPGKMGIYEGWCGTVISSPMKSPSQLLTPRVHSQPRKNTWGSVASWASLPEWEWGDFREHSGGDSDAQVALEAPYWAQWFPSSRPCLFEGY